MAQGVWVQLMQAFCLKYTAHACINSLQSPFDAAVVQPMIAGVATSLVMMLYLVLVVATLPQSPATKQPTKLRAQIMR